MKRFILLCAVAFIWRNSWCMQEKALDSRVLPLKELCLEKVMNKVQEDLKNEQGIVNWQDPATQKELRPFLLNIPKELLSEYVQKNGVKKTPKEKIRNILAVAADHSFCMTSELYKDVVYKTLISTQERVATFEIPNRKKGFYQGHLCDNETKIMLRPFGHREIVLYDLQKKISFPPNELHDFAEWKVYNNELFILDYDSIYTSALKEYTPELFFAKKGADKMLTVMPSGKIVILTLDCCPILYVIDKNSRTLLKKMSGHVASINSLAAFSSNLVASGCQDRTVRIWNIDSQPEQECKSVLPHDYPVQAVCFDKTGNYCISGTNYQEGTIYVWNIANSQCIFKDEVFDGCSIINLFLQSDSLIVEINGGKIVHYILPKKLSTLELCKSIESYVQKKA